MNLEVCNILHNHIPLLIIFVIFLMINNCIRPCPWMCCCNRKRTNTDKQVCAQTLSANFMKVTKDLNDEGFLKDNCQSQMIQGEFVEYQNIYESKAYKRSYDFIARNEGKPTKIFCHDFTSSRFKPNIPDRQENYDVDYPSSSCPKYFNPRYLLNPSIRFRYNAPLTPEMQREINYGYVCLNFEHRRFTSFPSFENPTLTQNNAESSGTINSDFSKACKLTFNKKSKKNKLESVLPIDVDPPQKDIKKAVFYQSGYKNKLFQFNSNDNPYVRTYDNIPDLDIEQSLSHKSTSSQDYCEAVFPLEFEEDDEDELPEHYS